MTAEYSENRTKIVFLLSECDCVFFKALSLPDQNLNREFRRAAAKGNYDIPGFYNSLCGQCIRNRETDTGV